MRKQIESRDFARSLPIADPELVLSMLMEDLLRPIFLHRPEAEAFLSLRPWLRNQWSDLLPEVQTSTQMKIVKKSKKILTQMKFDPIAGGLLDVLAGIRVGEVVVGNSQSRPVLEVAFAVAARVSLAIAGGLDGIEAVLELEVGFAAHPFAPGHKDRLHVWRAVFQSQ